MLGLVFDADGLDDHIDERSVICISLYCCNGVHYVHSLGNHTEGCVLTIQASIVNSVDEKLGGGAVIGIRFARHC